MDESTGTDTSQSQSHFHNCIVLSLSLAINITSCQCSDLTAHYSLYNYSYSSAQTSLLTALSSNTLSCWLPTLKQLTSPSSGMSRMTLQAEGGRRPVLGSRSICHSNCKFHRKTYRYTRTHTLGMMIHIDILFVFLTAQHLIALEVLLVRIFSENEFYRTSELSSHLGERKVGSISHSPNLLQIRWEGPSTTVQIGVVQLSPFAGEIVG